MQIMKRKMSTALAALSVAVPLIPAVETARDECNSAEQTQCPLRESHATDNRDIEPECPIPQPVTQRQVPTYSATIGATITVIR